jgi:hypothetical protein
MSSTVESQKQHKLDLPKVIRELRRPLEKNRERLLPKSMRFANCAWPCAGNF